MAETTTTTTKAASNRRGNSRLSLYWRRFVRNRPAVAGLVILILLVLFACFGNRFNPCRVLNPMGGGDMIRCTHSDIDFLALSQAPSGNHLFGTNSTGLDVYAIVTHGLQRSLVIAIVVSFVTVLIAAFLGGLAAYLGGKGEKLILGIVNFLLIMPAFLMMAIVASTTGGNWIWLIVVLIIFGWFVEARVIWQLSTSIRERDFVSAARQMGVPGWKVVFRHIVPNIGSLLVINFVLGVVSTVMQETALSYLGFGIKVPDVSLGSALVDGQAAIYTTPWAFIYPVAALSLLTISFGLMADGLRDALDPNSAAGGKA